MEKKSFFKRTPVKILLVTLGFVVTIMLGCIPLTLVLSMYQKLSIRIIIAVAGGLWAIFTTIWLWARFDYTELWRTWAREMKVDKMMKLSEKFPEYQQLKEKYPAAISHHERHWRHKKKKVSNDLMVKMALEVPEEEWAAREEFILKNREERKAFREHRPPTLQDQNTIAGEKI
ncbi:MAG: hypothetical protein IKN11_06135 [Bacteroidales bacterium]|nr:hypothetical protein [Bacteroidales bacterium]